MAGSHESQNVDVTLYMYQNSESKFFEESTNNMETEENKTLEMNNCINDDKDTIFNKTIQSTDEKIDQKNELKNKDIHNRLFRIIDSDAEDENIFIFNRKNKKSTYVESDNDMSDSQHENESNKPINSNTAKKFFDNNSNEMSSIHNDNDTEETVSNEEKATKASKEKAMKEIHSETQRLMRKAEISLPYHKPKQRTLQEFLSRKKVITVLPKAPTMAAKLKMSSAIVDEVLKEKEKEAEIFYKSSDSEEEEVMRTDKEPANINCTPGHKKDVVSRKLFITNSLSTEHNKEILEEIKEVENNEATMHDSIENNVDVSMITETHCESNSTENRNEVSESKITETTKDDKINDLLQKDVTDNECGEENIPINSDEHNSEIVNKLPNASTSKINDDYAKIVKQSLGLTVDESDEYNEYGLPPPKFDDSPNIDENKTLLNITNLKPKLRGTPGTMIDLSDDINPNKKEINALIDRFVHKHSKINKQIIDAPKVTTTQIKTSPNGLSIVKETLPYRLPNVVSEDPKLNKPGAKLMHLKEELKHKMALKREEEWKQKEQEIEWNVSISEENNLSEPYSPSIESHNSEDDELEENDVYVRKEKKRKKRSAFIEDEAEVSEHEINDSDEIEDEDEDEDENENENEIQEDSEEDEKSEEECEKLVLEDGNESSTCDSNDVPSKSKSFKRIVQPLNDDDSRFSYIENEQFSNNKSEIPIFQVHIENNTKHQRSQTPITKSSTFDLVSPIMQLTALNVHLEEEKEPIEVAKPLFTDEVESILKGSIQTPELSQQICNLKRQAISQKKLFVDEGDVLDEELIAISSGKFTEDKLSFNFSKEPDISESQLLDLCSGTFSSQANDPEQATTDLSKEIPQSIQLPKKKVSLSTKIDEQQLNKNTYWNKLQVVSSDEEDLLEKEINKRPTKRVKKLNLTDDEEENSSALSSDDEDKEDDNEKYIDYDSEENEVIVPKKNIKQYAATFLEEEAELSDSDCDVSADEDEEDLDKMELEEVDDEEIDEALVKKQVGKLHMKQLLDDDKKEVRMLQELLFEDGDLYSESARERKFKWKNIDKQADNNDSRPLEGKDGWVDLSDEEDEVNWRKMRYEREKFLAEKMATENTDIQNDLNSSQIFKFGLKVLKKRRIDESQKQNTLVETLDSKEESNVPYTIAAMLNNSTLKGNSRIHNVMQKRSFLARGQESLARLAALARRKEAPKDSIKAKNFFFAHVDRTTENESVPIMETKSKNVKTKRNR
ncbi:PREDICTED: claspin-like [Habropoda laboriosa]|uniref:claspin-like n=1 Tax=Habropoda laboriosa TaxID=597456 RepID=UPI00083CBA98|nr:PREDICTED: claspin-like [Habropoda laboriosa]